MNKPSLFSIALLAVATHVAAVEPLTPPTHLPETTRLEVSGKIFQKNGIESFANEAQAGSLITGFTTPIPCQWGPVDVFSGPNPWDAHSEKRLTRATFRLLPPEEVLKRIEAIRATTASLQERGISVIAPTFAFDTIVGDYRKRLGFWEFYDRWERYTKWAGPRPWNDPFDWLCVDRAGKPILNSGNSSPHRVKFDRYRCCIHHPDWAKFQRTVMVSGGEVGYRGAVADDVAPVPCFCRNCRRAFRAFLDDPNRPAWVDQLTKGKNLADLSLVSEETPPELIRRWRLLSTAAHIEGLQTAGKTSAPDGFEITAGGLPLAEAAPVGTAAGRLLFADVAAPGVRTTGSLPENNDLTVGVVDDAVQTEFLSYVFRIRHPGTEAILRAKIRLPALSRVGETLPITVEITLPKVERDKAGSVEGFHLAFANQKSAKKTEVPLSLKETTNKDEPGEETDETTASWTGTWSPEEPGTYGVSFGFDHRPKGDETAEAIPYTARLRWPRICRSHQAELLFAQQMQARPVFVGTEWYALRSPDSVKALGLAEMAAFGGGGGCVLAGPLPNDGPLRAVAEFPRAHPELFEGWQLDGSIGVLYSAWGSNRLSVQPNGPFSRLTHDLAEGHRPYVALIDRNLPSDAGALSGLKAVYLVSGDYDLSNTQIKVLQTFLAGDGRLVVESAGIRINGEPAATVLGPKVEIWNVGKPAVEGEPIVTGGAGTANVRVACYRKGGRIAVHLVNYNVCLLHPQGRAIPVRDLRISVPLPRDWRGVRVTAFVPGAAPASVTSATEAGRAVMTLPELRLYSVLLLEGPQ